MTEFVLRPLDWADPDLPGSEVNFVRGSWMKELSDSDMCDAFGPAYRDEYAGFRDRMMERGDVLVVALASVPTAVCGWACTEPGIVHFVVVKRRWRQLGLAKRLLAPFLELGAVKYSHRTRLLASLPIPPTWTYSPREAFR